MQGRAGAQKGGDNMVDMRVELCGIELDNPVMAASGTFGYGYEFAELYDINCLGSFSFKGTTLEPKFGNPLPRIAECDGGMINSIGLQNPGVEKVIEEELPKLAKCFSKKVMANVGGDSPREYAEVCERLEKCSQIGWFEINVSCPNVAHGGMAFGSDGQAAASVIREVKSRVKKPVIAKLSPNVTDIADIAEKCEEAGADGISLVNTFLGMRIDIKTRKPIIANKKGGFSGPAIFPEALRMVYDVYERVSVPIVGIGGIYTPEQVIEMMLAGASAVQIGAANLTDPYVCRDIVEKLPEVMEQYGIDDLKEITGGAHNG